MLIPSDRKDMPAEYEGMFKTNQWNALKIYKFYTGPNGHHFEKDAPERV